MLETKRINHLMIFPLKYKLKSIINKRNSTFDTNRDINTQDSESSQAIKMENQIPNNLGNPVPQIPQNNINVNDIFNNLRIPDCIRHLPQFEGNPRLLFEFLTNVEEILNTLSLIANIENSPYYTILLRAIRNKIVGPANEVLDMYGTSLNWKEIKQNLILHYSDKRNETSLIRDLHSLSQNSKTIEQFYGEIIENLSAANNFIQIHETEQSVITSKRNLHAQMCLNVFLTGLKEPLGATVRAMKPSTLAEAFAYCIQEQNISYQRNGHPNHQRNPQKQNFTNKPNNNFTPNFQPNFNRNNYNRPFYPKQNFPRSNFQQQSNYQRLQNTQEVNQRFQNNTNPSRFQNNFFKPNIQNQWKFQQQKNDTSQQTRFFNKNKFPTPQPMEVDPSGYSHVKGQIHNISHIPAYGNPQNYSQLFPVSTQNHSKHFEQNPQSPYQQLDSFYEKDNEVFEIANQNFQDEASENKSDT